MKLKEFTADIFLRGGIQKEEYRSIEPVICRKNRETLTLGKQIPRIVLPMWNLLYLIFGTYAVLLNTAIRPQLSSTTLCAFLVAAPLLIIDRP